MRSFHLLLSALLVNRLLGDLLVEEGWVADAHFRQFCLDPMILPADDSEIADYAPAFPSSADLGGLCRWEDFKVIRTVGRGNFGRAQLAEHLPTGQRVVLKNIFQSQHRPSVFQLVRNEECTLHVASQYCPFVVKHYCTVMDGVDVVLVMEWVEGRSLDRVIRDTHHQYGRNNRKSKRRDGNTNTNNTDEKGKITIDEGEFKTILAQIISTIEMLHELRIMFYDIRLKNIMLRAEDKQIRLIDFGLASFHYPDPLPRVFRTPEAPEFSIDHIPHMDDFQEPDRPIIDDWYDLGLLIHEAYSGAPGGPFHRMVSEYKFYLKYHRGIDCPPGMPDDTCRLMQALCAPQVEDRLGLIPDSPRLFRLNPFLIDAQWP